MGGTSSFGWTGGRDRFRRLFGCCLAPFISMAEAHGEMGWQLNFWRPFGLAEAVEWDNLTREIQNSPLSLDKDSVSWCLEASGSFTTRSIYLRLSQGAAVTHFKEVWHTYVPPRIKMFLWQLIRDRLPCSEQVTKCHDPSDGLCALCGALEDCNHIFFHAL